MVAFVPALVQLSYAGLRSIASKYGKKRIQGIMKELGVDRKTAKEINNTYNTVKKKGDITQKLGGKDVVSNKNVINVRVDKPQADVLKSNPITSIGGTGQKKNLIGTTQSSSNKVTKGSINYPQGEKGKGLLTTAKEGVGKVGRGLLNVSSDPRVIGGGLLGGGIYSASGEEETFDSRSAVGTDRRQRDASGNLIYNVFDNEGNIVSQQANPNLTKEQQELGFTAKTIGAEEIKAPTLSEYNEFKSSMNIYNRQREDGSFLERASNPLNDPDNPINKQGNEQLASIYANDPSNIYRTGMNQNEYIGLSPEEAEQARKAKFNAQMNVMNLQETDADARQKSDAQKGFDALAQAQAAIKTGSAISEIGTKEQDKYPGFARIEADSDRNIFQRTFDIGEEPKYVRKVFDTKSNTYIVPDVEDPRYDVVTEDEIVSGKKNVVVPGTIQDPTTGIISTGENITATENLRPDVRTVNADGTMSTAQSEKPQDVPLKQKTSDIFALANYLGQLSQGGGSFMGQQQQPMGFLNNTTPMQNFYGQRPLGFFDPEYYKKGFGFFD